MAYWYSTPSNYTYGRYTGSTSNISMNFNTQVSGYYRVFIPYDYTYGNLLFNLDTLANIPDRSALSGTLYSSGNVFTRISYGAISHTYLDTGFLRGRVRVWRSNENYEGFHYFTPLETTTISGKYKIPSTINTVIPALLRQGTIPVKFSINDENYNYITFPDIYEQYASLTSTSMSRNNYATAFYKLPIDLERTTAGNDVGYVNIMENPTSTSSNVVSIIYANNIIDFGNVGQEVPLIFKTWFESVFEPVYSYTYTVKTNDGESVVAQINEAPAMVDATSSAVGNVKTVTMTGVNGRTYSMTWESETPAGKQFLGLAYGANENRASIPTGRTTPVTWDGSLTIYEVYGTYRPPVTTFDINLYQSSAEVNRVDKTDFLTGVGTLSGVLREECSIIAPSITFKQTTVPVFNYVYIAAFGRYYYVTGITSVSKDMWRMSLSCDVLMTWRDDIRALTAIIARQENSFNPLLLDSELPAQANQNITVTEFPAGGFNTADAIAYPFVLTVVGA